MNNGKAVAGAARLAGGMRLEALEAHDVPADILAIWRETVGPELLPVQARAVRECGLLSTRDNLIVFSPTSSGKTFIGEMAAVKAAREGTRVFYLVPQRALADEKFLELLQRYERLGLRVVISSSDHREYDEAIGRGDFDIAIVVFEKLQVLLVRRPELIDIVGLVVVDEMQLLTDAERGPSLEVLLTKLRLAPSAPRVLGLSAVLGRAELLAKWLGARLLVDRERPVELRKGVLCRGQFRYREHNSGAEGVEDFPAFRSNERDELMIAAIEELVRRGEQVLVFLPDRKTTVSLAKVLADRLELPPAPDAVAALDDQEETHVQEGLRRVLRASIAFHNSDLSVEERSIVERNFRSGAIRVLCSTSTLAVGMNLPTKNVLLDLRKWQFVPRYGRTCPVEVTKSDYENMSGRAGRLAFASDFGRSIVVTDSPFQADVWMRTYVQAEFEPVGPMLQGQPLENHVLNLLTSGLAHSRAELERLLLASFTGFVHWSQAMSSQQFAAALDRAIVECRDGGLIRDHTGADLVVTDLGRACASKGIDVQTGIRLAHWTELARDRPVRTLEMLVVLGLTPSGEDAYVELSRDERFRQDYRGRLLSRLRVADVADRKAFERLANDRMALEYADAKAVKKALVLADWIAEVPTKDIEREYFVSGGMLRRIGGEYAWLVEGLGAVAEASGWGKERCRVFDMLAERLLYGVRPDALPLARMRVRSLRRAHVRALLRAGLADPDALRAAHAEVIQGVLQNETAFASLATHLGLGEPPAGTSSTRAKSSGEPEPPDDEPILVLDLHERRVTFRGVAIPTRPPNNLQRQPFFAVACLAERPGTMVPMEEIAAYVHAKARLPGIPVPSEARDMRYRMLRPFRRHVPAEWSEEIEDLVEVVQGVGLRLNLRGKALVVRSRGVAPSDVPMPNHATSAAARTEAPKAPRPAKTSRRRSVDAAPVSTTA